MNQLVPSGRDLFLYLSTVDNVLHHLVVFSLKDLYLERIQLKVITLDKKARTLVTDHWIFTFQSEDSVTYLEKISGQVSEHEVQEILMDGSESEAHCDQSLHEDLKEKEDVEEYDADADSEGKGEEYYESFVDKGGDSSPSDEDLKEKEDVEAYDAYADSEGKGEEYYESFVNTVGDSSPSDEDLKEKKMWRSMMLTLTVKERARSILSHSLTKWGVEVQLMMTMILWRILLMLKFQRVLL